MKNKETKTKDEQVELNEEKSHKFLKEIGTAVKMDHESNKKGKAGLCRLHLLNKFNTEINNKKRQRCMLDNGLLDILKTWLEPLPDKCFPGEKIKICVLESLLNLPVRRTHLMNTSLGIIVNYYSKNLREDMKIRKLADNVVRKWSNIVLSNPDEEDDTF